MGFSFISHAQQPLHESKLDSAIVVFKKEIQNADTDQKKALLLLQLGNAYKLKQEYENSLNSYHAALQIFKTQQFIQEEFQTYTHLAELYRYVRQYEKAETYLKNCEKILKKHEIADAYRIKYYDRKSALFSEYSYNKDSAFVYAQKALNLSQKIGDKENAMVSMMEIAFILENQKKYRQAIPLIKEVVEYAKQTDNRQLYADALINLCRNYGHIEDYKSSLKESLEGFRFSEENNMPYNQLRFADHLQHVYEIIGDYKNAYHYLYVRLGLTEEYYHKLYNEKFVEYEEKFQAVEKQKTIEENERALKLKEEELKRASLIKYVILFGLLVIIIFSTILIFKIRIIKKQNQELVFISDQNEFLVSETHHRVNNNLQLITILIENELDKVSGTDTVAKKNILTKMDSLALLHRQLYHNKNKKDLNLKEFLMNIQQNLDVLMFENNVEVNFEIDDFVVPIDQAMYIGLLLTELSINSLKHAFEGVTDKKINLSIREENQKIYFDYTDNGKKSGVLPKLILIDKLCRQLKVNYQAELENGFKFKFTL